MKQLFFYAFLLCSVTITAQTFPPVNNTTSAPGNGGDLLNCVNVINIERGNSVTFKLVNGFSNPMEINWIDIESRHIVNANIKSIIYAYDGFDANSGKPIFLPGSSRTVTVIFDRNIEITRGESKHASVLVGPLLHMIKMNRPNY